MLIFGGNVRWNPVEAAREARNNAANNVKNRITGSKVVQGSKSAIETGGKVARAVGDLFNNHSKPRGAAAGYVRPGRGELFSAPTKAVSKQQANIIREVHRLYDEIMSQRGSKNIRAKIDGRLLEYEKNGTLMRFTAASVEEAQNIVTAFENRGVEVYCKSQTVNVHIDLD